MRLLLDAQISQHGVAGPLRNDGHDVLAAVENRALDGVSDETLLKLATSEKRILVTFNLIDFVPLIARLAAEGEGHCGCILISAKSIRPSQFRLIVDAIRQALRRFPTEALWHDRVVWLGRGT